MPILTSAPVCSARVKTAGCLSIKFSVVLAFIAAMTACGGGGGGGGGGGKAASSRAPISSSPSLSSSSVSSAASSSVSATAEPFASMDPAIMAPIFQEMSDSHYRGISTAAEIDEVNLKVFIQYLFQTSNDFVVGARFKSGAGLMQPAPDSKSQAEPSGEILPVLAELAAMISMDNDLGMAQGSVDTTFDKTVSCRISGNRTLKGVERTDGSHEVLTSYTNCRDFEDSEINGRVASFRTINGETIKSFYENYQVIRGKDQWLVNGHVDYYEVDFGYFYIYNLTLDDQESNEQYKLANFSEEHYTTSGYAASLEGEIYVGSIGKLAIATPDMMAGYPPKGGSVSLTGSNNASGYVNFLEHGIVVAIDADNDGNLDRGVAVADTEQFEDFVETAAVFIPVNEINFPPSVGYFYWESYFANTLTELRVSAPGSVDPEAQTLSLSYEWYINGILSEISTTATFPAQIARAGDSVKVYAVVSDGVNTTRRSSDELIIQDALGVPVIDMPGNSVAPGDTVKFKASVLDPDNPDSALGMTMLSAPEGATIDDNGNVEWVALVPVLGQSMDYRFTFDATGLSGNTSEPIEAFVTVVDETKALPTARFGIQMGSNRHSMWVGDYDGDSLNELLATDGVDRVFTVNYDDGIYQQSWMYPLALNTPEILRVLKANYDSDSADDIVVVGSRNVNLIADLDKTATEIITLTDASFRAAQVYDLDGDGVAELIAITSDFYQGSSPKLVVFALTSGELLKSINLSSRPDELVIGNIDNDAAPEIVLANGYVYDTATWKNEWYYSSGFGTHLTIGDLDSNGIDEVVTGGVAYGSELRVFSGITKTLVASLPVNSIQSVNVAGSLILLGEGSSYSLATYSFNGTTLTKQQELLSTTYQNVSGAVAGDTDGDGLVDFHLASSSSLKVIGGNQVIWNEEGAESYLENFVAAGWIKPTPDTDEQAIFSVSTTEWPYGQRLAFMSDAGVYSITEPLNIGYHSNDARYGVVLDFDKDGDGEIFTSNSSSGYSNQFVAYSLDDLSELANSRSDQNADSAVSIVEGQDINDDGYADALYVKGRLLTIRDIANNGVIISTDISTDQPITDFAFVETNTDGAIDLVVAASGSLSVWRKEVAANDTVTFVKKFSHEINCSRVLARKSGAEIEIYCSHTYGENLTRLAYLDTGIAVASSQVISGVNGAVTDMAFSEINPAQLYLGLAANSQAPHYMHKHYLGVYDLERKETIGQVNVVGRIAARSIHERAQSQPGQARVMLATSRAMYLFR